MEKMQAKPYELLSNVYSDLMSNVDYNKWARYLYSVLKPYISNNPKIIEITSGTGLIAENFMEFVGKEIYVSDISLQMLQKANNLHAGKICADIRALPFNSAFDIVYSTFDSINYILTKNDVMKTFKSVNQIMKRNGIFAFDVSLLNNSVKHQKRFNYSGKENDFEYSRKSSFDSELLIHSTIFEIKTPTGEIYTEEHKQRIYPFEYYFEVLEKCGFWVLQCLDSFTDNSANCDSYRAQFIVKKY